MSNARDDLFEVLRRRIVQEFAESLSDESPVWTSGTLDFIEVALVGAVSAEGRDADGERIYPMVESSTSALLSDLRREMHGPELGTWWSCELSISRDGEPIFDFNFDDRVYLNVAQPEQYRDPTMRLADTDDRPSLVDYHADLERFPRADSAVPVWLTTPEGAR